MKKVFGIIFAIVLVPTFNTYAWVGGPFTNNSHTPEGDDGIYEAVGTTVNGMGLYRWGVGNVNAATTYTDGRTGNTGNVQFGGFAGNSNQHTWYFEGNVYYGTCFGTVNSSVGVVNCVGNAADLVPGATNQGVLAGPGISILSPSVTQILADADGDGTTTEVVALPNAGVFCNSFFTATMNRRPTIRGPIGGNPASREFSGQGTLFVGTTPLGSLPGDASTGQGTQRTFFVFGSRVSLVRTG